MSIRNNSSLISKIIFWGRRFFSSPLGAGGLKIAITALCLWYVSLKIEWVLTWQLLEQSNKGWLLAAVSLYVASRFVFSFRLNIFFKNVGVYISEAANIRLSWLGMFYNLFLPGGIGGDAYKVILLKKRNEAPVKKLSAAVVLDRISGAAALAMLSAIYYFLVYKGRYYSLALIIAIAPALVAYYYFIRKVFPSFLQSIWRTLLLGILVQFLQVLCTYCLLASINISHHYNEYIFLFLLSSIVAVLPFTIGGLGARELVFLWGSERFLLDTHESIYISMLFYLISVFIALAGIRWVYKDPLEDKGSS